MMLRYQPAIGPATDSQVTRYLGLPVVPTYLGFDPRLQFIHVSDGLEALVASIKNPLRGAVNVAAPGTIGLTRMIRLAGKTSVPIASPLFPTVATLGRRAACSAACRPTSGACSATAAGWTRAAWSRRSGSGRASTPPRRSRTTCAPSAASGSCPASATSCRPHERATRGAARSARSRRRRRRRPRTLPPGEAALFPVGAALGFLRRLREGVESGSDPVSALSSAVGGLPRGRAARGSTGRCAGSAGDYSEDEWGFDEEFADAVFPFLEFMYERWWRVQVEGTVNVPSHGPALMVSNHAGIVPLGRDHDGHRDPEGAPAPALPAVPGAELGVHAAVRLVRAAQGRRRSGVALQRDPAARAGRARRRVPRGRQGSGEGLQGPLPPPALRPRRLRGDRAANARADRARGGRRQRGDPPEDRRVARCSPARPARLTSRSRRRSRCSVR